MNKVFKENIALLQQDPTALAASWQQSTQIIWQAISGLADMKNKVAATTATPFPISSVTKHFTAFLVWQLWQKHKLDLEAPITEFLFQLPPRYNSVCIKHLIFHSSGLADPYEYYLKQNWETNGITNADVIQLLKNTELHFEAGSKFHYCNSNYILLALVCEKLWQNSFQFILQKQIFQPLKMENSFLFTRYSQQTIKGYNKDNLQPVDNSWYTYGDGCVNASLQDLQKWSAFLLSQNSYWQDVMNPPTEFSSFNYSWGWILSENIYHLGGDPGFGSLILMQPDRDKALIMLSNLDDSWKLMREIAKAKNK